MEVTDEFAALVARPEASITLDRGALLIAAHFHPGLDIDAQLERLDELARACPDASIDALRRHLFVVEGFAGNREHYDDPRNSLLNEVLDRRLGIPISLAVVMLEVGRRIGVALSGVGMPGHFLVGAGPELFVDPFHGGQVLDIPACRERFRAVLGTQVHWDPTFLAPTGPLLILNRMLANLRQLFAAANDLVSLRWVLALRVAMPGAQPEDRQALATVLTALGAFDEAARLVEAMAGDDPSTDRSRELQAQALSLRSRLN